MWEKEGLWIGGKLEIERLVKRPLIFCLINVSPFLSFLQPTMGDRGIHLLNRKLKTKM